MDVGNPYVTRLGKDSPPYLWDVRRVCQRVSDFPVQSQLEDERQVRPEIHLLFSVRRSVAKMYLRAYKLSGKKAAWRQEMAWKHLLPVFATMQPQHITTAKLSAYQEMRIAEGAGNATANRELAALSASLYHAARCTVENGKQLLAFVPVFPEKSKEPPPRSGFLNDKQYAVLASHAKEPWMRLFIAIGYSFGFRRAELLTMRTRQVGLIERWLELEPGTTKNDDGRKVKMTAEIYELALACVRGKNPDDFVFTRANGTPVRDPRDDWYGLCVASGLGRYVPAKRANGEDYGKYVGLNPHDFRRAAIKNMDSLGVSQTISMKISGHRTISAWRRYRIGDDPDLESATAKIELGRQVCSAGETQSTATSTKTDTATYAHS